MESLMNRSMSESDISNKIENSSPNYVVQRNKRRREPDYQADFTAFKEEMKSWILSLISESKEDIKKIYPTLMEIKHTNSNIESSIAFLSAQSEDLKKKIEQMEAQAKMDKDYITILEEKIEELQRSSRKTCLEIKNVPKASQESKEDLLKMIEKISSTIGCSIIGQDIKDIYRVNIKNKKSINPPIIVELGSTIQKTEFLKMAKTYNIKHKDKLSTKHLGLTTNEYNPIYIAEQLTAKSARLHFLARDLAKAKNYKYCWTAYGRVYVRKDDHSPIMLIRSESQVAGMMQAV